MLSKWTKKDLNGPKSQNDETELCEINQSSMLHQCSVTSNNSLDTGSDIYKKHKVDCIDSR